MACLIPVTGLQRSNSYFKENVAIVESYLQHEPPSQKIPWQATVRK